MIATFYSLLTAFFLTLQSHFIYGGDSAEYTTIAKTWGIAHPPGYPLYSLLANMVEKLIFFETSSWKIALLSSVPTIVTSYIIYRIFLHLKVQKYIALTVSFLYVFIFPIWQYALVPEVFALHLLLVSLITYLLLKYLKRSNNTYLYIVSFLVGLCVSNHHIFVLFIPGWFFLIKEKIKRITLNRVLCVQMFLLACLGASFYLYAVLVSMSHTILDWENAKTFGGFFSLITRSSYGSFKAYSGSGANIGNQLSDIISGFVFIFMDFKPLGILLIGLGIFIARTYGKQFSRFIYVSLIVHFVFLFYTNFVLTSTTSSGMYERFLIPIYFLLILLFGIGVDYFYKSYYFKVVNVIKNLSLRRVARVGYFVFICLFILIIAKQNFKTISLISNLTTFEQFGKDIIETVPQGGILTTQGDTSTFTSMYRLYALKERSDIVFFQLGLMGKRNYIDMIKKRTPNLIIPGPVKGTADFESFVIKNSSRGYYAEREMNVGTWRPYGLLWKYYPDNLSASSDSANLLAKNKFFWQKQYIIPQLTAAHRNIFHLNSTSEYYLNSYQNYAKFLVFLNQYEDAEVVLKNISEKYKQNDLQSKAAYMNILVLQNKCSEATVIAKKIDVANTVKKYHGFVKPVLSYLQKCDTKNSDIPRYKKLLIEYEKGAKTELNSF